MRILDKTSNSGRFVLDECWSAARKVPSILKKLVGTPRFELGTPCTPCGWLQLPKSLGEQELSTGYASRIQGRSARVNPCNDRMRGSDSGRDPMVAAAIRECSGARCECQGDTCARDHTGRCLNAEGALTAGSHYPTRLHIVDGRELCSGCCEPYRKSLTRPRRRRIPAAEGELRQPSSRPRLVNRIYRELREWISPPHWFQRFTERCSVQPTATARTDWNCAANIYDSLHINFSEEF